MSPAPSDLIAQLQKRKASGGGLPPPPGGPRPGGGGAAAAAAAAAAASSKPSSSSKPKHPLKQDPQSIFEYDDDLDAFLFFGQDDTPTSTKFVPFLVNDQHGNKDTDICIPLAPCAYRMTDYTFAKKEPVLVQKCLIKLGVLRCLQRECQTLNTLLKHRLSPNPIDLKPKMPLLLDEDDDDEAAVNTRTKKTTTLPSSSTSSRLLLRPSGTMEEDELGKVRFMELLSNCGVYQKVSELILQRVAKVVDFATSTSGSCASSSEWQTIDSTNGWHIPQIKVDGLDEFLQKIEDLTPALQQARNEISIDQSVSFYPGLGEFFKPGSKLLCHPDGMEGSPLGCTCVQSWYAEELNQATGKTKRRFVLVIEFIVSVGDELVFVAASDVYPEFHDVTRNMPIKDLTHRRLDDSNNPDDKAMLDRLQQRGEFYASVAIKNHYLEYYADSFFPIIGGGWSSNAVRPLSKGGRVMVDVKRGILEGHMPIRGSSSDGMSDTVKEAIKLFEQSKRTGVAVPFRTCILPEFEDIYKPTTTSRPETDRGHCWQCWPMLTGFSFTARVWGKLLLGMPKITSSSSTTTIIDTVDRRSNMTSPRRPSTRKFGVERAALGGEGSCGNCGYINFQEQAFEQLVLAEDKKELIRAVARNAGGGPKFDEKLNEKDDGAYNDDDYDVDDDDSVEDAGIDVVANKGGASIFLLHGPPGCGKTLTAEAIAELLKKPLYIVTAGDLGITASEVEKTLGSVLDLCQTWDALVLIDEADIFLEARNSTEIQRNALVCVMLRLLEYYSGCLFLSSNREASTIDPAIASRITVMLGYPPLGPDGRAKVWKNLIQLVPGLPVDPATGEVQPRVAKNPRKVSKYRSDFSDDDYKSLASGYELNGRQIKNSIVLARALARERGMPLSMPVLHRAVTAVAGERVALSK